MVLQIKTRNFFNNLFKRVLYRDGGSDIKQNKSKFKNLKLTNNASPLTI